VLQPARVDVATMLHSLADMLRRTLDQRVHILVDVERDCPAVRADPGQLESALLNIAINARDAMPQGGQLSFAAHGGAGDRVTLSVADTGSGMSDEVRERAFEPFFTTKAMGRGTGLGLSTVYGFVKQSNGTVWLDSAPGRGTTVRLWLPRWRASDVSTVPADARAPELPRHLKVLLVEDEPEVRKVIGTFLTSLGVRFTTATDGEQALAWLDSDGDVDLLLSDILLGPGMRGTELARLAQQRDSDLAVLLMSGFAPELLEADHEQPLRWELLRKPCTREDLAAALARSLAMPTAR